MEKYPYRAFGLNIHSELECPELQPNSQEADVTVKFGDVPDELSDAHDRGVRYWAAPGKFLLKVDGVAKYLIQDGTSITIERLNEADDTDLRLFLLGSAFAALMHQREMLILHASAIIVGDECVLFKGRSGAGKSTTAASFKARGYKILSDDVCAISFDQNDRPVVMPSYPQMKLWLDSMKKLELEADQFKKVRSKIEKRAVPVNGSFYEKPVPIKKMYLLNNRNEDCLELNEITGPRKFSVLKNQTYRRQFLKGLGKKGTHFMLGMKLSTAIPIKQVVRPSHDMSRLPEMLDMLEKDFLS